MLKTRKRNRKGLENPGNRKTAQAAQPGLLLFFPSGRLPFCHRRPSLLPSPARGLLRSAHLLLPRSAQHPTSSQPRYLSLLLSDRPTPPVGAPFLLSFPSFPRPTPSVPPPLSRPLPRCPWPRSTMPQGPPTSLVCALPPAGSFAAEPGITRNRWCDPLPPCPAPPAILAVIAPCTHAQNPGLPFNLAPTYFPRLYHATLQPPPSSNAVTRLAPPHRGHCSTVEPPLCRTPAPANPRISSAWVPGSSPRPSPATPARVTAGIAPRTAAGETPRHLDSLPPVVPRPS
jgi:hypothetical protein